MWFPLRISAAPPRYPTHQISAIQAALEKVALGLLDGHARHCLAEGHGGPASPDEQADELMGAVGRLLSR